MNQLEFALRNISDKLLKILRSPRFAGFYVQHYILGNLERMDPGIYIISYPKSGRTWLMSLLRNYFELYGLDSNLFNDKSCFKLPNKKVVKFDHGRGGWVPAPVKIQRLCFNTEKYVGKKITFLARDPRDILVSSWHHLRFREKIYQGSLSEFIRDDLVGIRKVIAFMNIWLENSHVPDGFHLLTYEQLHSDPIFSFRRLLDFMGVPVISGVLESAVKESSFEKMKRMELKGSFKEPWMKPGSKNTNHSVKIRKGKVGGFRQELSIEDIEFLNDVIRRELSTKLSFYHL